MFGAGLIACLRLAGRRAVGPLALLVAMSLPAVAQDDPFQIRYNVDRTGPSVRVSGTVVNEGRADALEVYVTAEALDAGGKVLGRGVAFVSQTIPQRASAPFVISVPAAQAAASFRVRVSSVRFGLGVQAS